MKTIGEIHKAKTPECPVDQISYLSKRMTECRESGDFLGAGEWAACSLPHLDPVARDRQFSSVLALWCSVNGAVTPPASIHEFAASLAEFDPEHVGSALITASARLRAMNLPPLEGINDVAFKLKNTLPQQFAIGPTTLNSLIIVCTAKYERAFNSLIASVGLFARANCGAAKTAAIEIVKEGRQFKKVALAAEKPLLSEIDLLLGPNFRSFCEYCERKQREDVLKFAPDLRDQAQRILHAGANHENSTLWQSVIAPVALHVIDLVDEESAQSEKATSPELTLATDVFKLDLSAINKEMVFSCRLANHGDSLARKIQLHSVAGDVPVELRIIDPRAAFEINGKCEQVVTFGLTVRVPAEEMTLTLGWKCETILGRTLVIQDVLKIQQQHIQPDWNRLKKNPPYGTNPIGTREKLFGRNATLNELAVKAAARTSTILWGSKRVGKTSIVLVLLDELKKQGGFCAIMLRCGEILGKHEGQIAHIIAARLSKACRRKATGLDDEEFGAGLSQLIPFAEDLVQKKPDTRFLVIIDEFDELESALYVGQRGRMFVAALRSLSEIGITFFFVGSERMSTIYRRHSMELNKWAEVHLDVIASREDCKALIALPVSGAIEYERAAMDSILDYCGGNPYFMQILCASIFERCSNEARTFVGESDLDGIRRSLIGSLSEGHFKHFWHDVPELEDCERLKEEAENCLVLTCLAHAAGAVHTLREVEAAQEALGLGNSTRASSAEIAGAVERLRLRSVLTKRSGDQHLAVKFPIFWDWLKANSELKLLPVWTEFCKKREEKSSEKVASVIPTVSATPFVISEDDLLATSQNLIYCGIQKDASELRAWLEQFDDENRIETAYLLLHRLAECGFVNEGARGQLLSHIADHLHLHRQKIGKGVWTILKGRIDNLCISYLPLDPELRSGAESARRLATRLRPAKTGPPDKIAEWMRARRMDDPVVLFVNDFTGTGTTLARGMDNLFENYLGPELSEWYRSESRLICSVVSAFPKALEKLRVRFPALHFYAARVFDENVQALNPNAGIFRNEAEMKFARSMLLQLGRELLPQHPLGVSETAGLVCFHDSVPNNTLPVFWRDGMVNEKRWKPLFPSMHEFTEPSGSPDQPKQKPIARSKVFISYAHSDAEILKRLKIHLKSLERAGLVDLWDDTRIPIGAQWEEEISRAIDEAKVAILLVSADFIASEFIHSREFPRLLKAASDGGARIMPLLVSPSRFATTPEIGQFQAFNQSGRELSALNRNEVETLLVRVAVEVEQTLKGNAA